MKNLLQISLSLIGVLMSITLVQSPVNPQIDVVKKAQEITVQINGKEQGTGVIVARGYKSIYTVLSSCHVFDLNYRNNLDNPNYKPQPKGYYVLRLYDGEEYPINAEEDVQCHPQVDLAIIRFSSQRVLRYFLAEIEDSEQLKPNTPIYLYGWTTVDDISPERAERFEQGTVQAIRTNGQKGYTLIHNVVSRPAMSGGPVLDQQGRLIGINGLVNPQTKESYAVPINFYKNWNPDDYMVAYHFYYNIPDNSDGFNEPKWIISKHWLQVLQFWTQKGDSLRLGYDKVLSPDRQWLASGSDDFTIKLWNLKTGHLERTFTGYSGIVEFSPDGQWLASQSSNSNITIALLNLKTGHLERTFTGHSYSVSDVAFSPDEQWLASGSDDKTIKLWNLKNGQLERTFTGHSYSVSDVAFSPDGQWLASGSYDNTIKLWNLKTGQLERTFTGHSEFVESVEFSPDGQWLASGSRDNTIKLWNLKTGQLERTLSRKKLINNLEFSPDGQWLAILYWFDIRNVVTDWDVIEILKLPPTFAVSSPSKSSPSFTAQDYYDLGKAYLAEYEFEFAIEQFNEAIRLNPNNSGAYYNRGVAYASKENYEQAIIDYTQAIKINQNWDNFSIADAYEDRGRTYKYLKNYENALNDYNQLISLNPDSLTYYRRGYFYFEQKNYEQAVNDYTKAIEINQGWGHLTIEDVYFQRGRGYLTLENYDQAIQDYNQVILKNPDADNAYEAYFYRGLAYYSQGNYDQAIQDYNQVILKNPDADNAYYNRGLAYQEKGDKQKALEDFQKAAALYQQQNNTEMYQKALDRIKELTN